MKCPQCLTETNTAGNCMNMDCTRAFNYLAPLIKIGEQVQGIKHVRIEGNAPKELNKLASDLMDYFESDKYTYGLRSENVKQIEAFLKKSQEAAIVEAIQFLRKEEGDYLTIACENPDPISEVESQMVTCAGFWTMKEKEWREIPFMGKTLLEALQNAVAHRKQFEGETIP